jgi:Flp pilus assembly protein TadG
MRGGHNHRRGSSLPETAIIMAVLLSMMIGIVDFGRAMYTYAFVAQLARQGARWATVRGSQCTLLDHCNAQTSDVQTYVRSLSVGATTANGITATATWPSCPPGSSGNAPGCVVKVTVNYTFKFLLPWFPAALPLSSTSEMVVSQ